MFCRVHIVSLTLFITLTCQCVSSPKPCPSSGLMQKWGPKSCTTLQETLSECTPHSTMTVFDSSLDTQIRIRNGTAFVDIIGPQELMQLWDDCQDGVDVSVHWGTGKIAKFQNKRLPQEPQDCPDSRHAFNVPDVFRIEVKVIECCSDEAETLFKGYSHVDTRQLGPIKPRMQFKKTRKKVMQGEWPLLVFSLDLAQTSHICFEYQVGKTLLGARSFQNLAKSFKRAKLREIGMDSLIKTRLRSLTKQNSIKLKVSGFLFHGRKVAITPVSREFLFPKGWDADE